MGLEEDIKYIKEDLRKRPHHTERAGLYIMVFFTMVSSCYTCIATKSNCSNVQTSNEQIQHPLDRDVAPQYP